LGVSPPTSNSQSLFSNQLLAETKLHLYTTISSNSRFFALTLLAMDNIPSPKLSLEAINYMIHHIFLPPKLPQGSDFSFSFETHLLETVIDALGDFKNFIAMDQKTAVDFVTAMVTNLKTMRGQAATGGAVCEGKLQQGLKDLCEKGKDRFPGSKDLKIYAMLTSTKVVLYPCTLAPKTLAS
jgi:hypothetical protein